MIMPALRLATEGAIREAFNQFATGLNFRDIICIPISALKGDMVVERGENLPWYEGPALLELLENIEIDYDLNLDDFRFPVQWVCRPATLENHDFRGYMGRIESGIVNVGDRVTVLPSSRSSTLKQILRHRPTHNSKSDESDNRHLLPPIKLK